LEKLKRMGVRQWMRINGMDKQTVIENNLMDREYIDFVLYLHDRIRTAHQSEGTIPYLIHPLSKTQVYLIRKRNPDLLSFFYENGGGDKNE